MKVKEESIFLKNLAHYYEDGATRIKDSELLYSYKFKSQVDPPRLIETSFFYIGTAKMIAYICANNTVIPTSAYVYVGLAPDVKELSLFNLCEVAPFNLYEVPMYTLKDMGTLCLKKKSAVSKFISDHLP